jgi:hypothetical protein
MKSKKELKEQYKQLQPVMGVFLVKNKVTDKVFIEGSTNIKAKWNRHQTELRFNSHRNKALQNDWNEYTSDNFAFEIVSELEYKEEENNYNYAEEVKLLKELVIEELNLPEDKRY